jgi:hypothetical protein
MRQARLTVVSVACAVLACVALPGAQDRSTPPLTRAQMAEFLLHAKVVAHHSLSKGTTKPTRLTLTDGATTHDAVFQSIDETAQRERLASGHVELNFRDSYHYNIAAYRLAELIAMGDMVPVTVERGWNGAKGSLAWWIDWKWDEMMRRKEDAHAPPDRAIPYSNEVHLSRLFAQLVDDTDRNQTNTLITADWHLYMVDFTRAFRTADVLQRPEGVQRCSHEVLQKLEALTRDTLVQATGGHLEPAAVSGVLARRDKIVARLRALVAERGEASVLF